MANIFTIGGKTVEDVQIGGKTVQSIYDNTHSVLLWEKSSAEPDYFYLEDRSGAANSVTLVKSGSVTEWVSLEYSTDGSSWSTWDISQSLPITANGRVYLRGDNGRMATASNSTHTFSSTGDVYAGGHIVTLLDSGGDTSNVNLNHTFCGLFNGMSTLVGVSNTLFQGITSADTGTFRETFGGCGRLANVPSLAISSLAVNASDTFRSTFYQCYAVTDASNISFTFTTTYTRTLYQTFTGCSALVTPPDLSSITILGVNALQAAFSGCNSLTTLRVGFTDWGDGTATRNWTRNILTSGVFTCPTTLPQTRNSEDGTTTADFIPYNWSIVNI